MGTFGIENDSSWFSSLLSLEISLHFYERLNMDSQKLKLLNMFDKLWKLWSICTVRTSFIEILSLRTYWLIRMTMWNSVTLDGQSILQVNKDKPFVELLIIFQQRCYNERHIVQQLTSGLVECLPMNWPQINLHSLQKMSHSSNETSWTSSTKCKVLSLTNSKISSAKFLWLLLKESPLMRLWTILS